MRGPLLPIIIFAAGLADAQPVVTTVANAASNALPGQPNAAIAQGAMFVIYGTGMGPRALVQAPGFPLGTGLSGTSAKVMVAGASLDAIMIYASATQIAGILPSSTPMGVGTITVTYSGQTSASVPITVSGSNFGIFTVAYADSTLVSFDKAANPGETLLIWGTGLGPVKGDEAAGPLSGDLAGLPVEVFVGGKPAAVTYRGRSGCCAGLDQIAFVVPDGITGCNVPLAVKINDKVSNFTSMAVASTGRDCPNDGMGVILDTPIRNIGSVTLTRSMNQSTTTNSDDGSASFGTLATFSLSTLFPESVPVGACTVFTSLIRAGTVASGGGSDAGPAIAVSGPNGDRSLPKTSSSAIGTSYAAHLGDATTGNYLDPGVYAITGPGGADIGPFRVSLTVPQPLVWTNQDMIATVVRQNPVAITWTGGSTNGYVHIMGSRIIGRSAFAQPAVIFTCRAKVNDESFTVPPYVLLSLPPGSGTLSIRTTETAQPFTATGLAFGFATSLVQISKSVTYQESLLKNPFGNHAVHALGPIH